jgi:hypothetical protein
MVHVKRDDACKITAVSLEPTPVDAVDGRPWDEIDAASAELALFLGAVKGQTNPLGVSDLGLVRVLEDLVALLVDQSVIRFTDLPPAAQSKLNERRGTREAMQSLHLLDSDQGGII